MWGGGTISHGYWEAKSSSQGRKEGKIGLNQSLIYVHPFTNFFYLHLFISVAKILLLCRKSFWQTFGSSVPPSPQVMGMDRCVVQTSITVNPFTDMSWYTEPDYI